MVKFHSLVIGVHTHTCTCTHTHAYARMHPVFAFSPTKPEKYIPHTPTADSLLAAHVMLEAVTTLFVEEGDDSSESSTSGKSANDKTPSPSQSSSIH